MMLNFCMLSLMHFLEGHYSCASVPKKFTYSPQCWKLTTFLYECCVVVILEITFCYWTIVYPFMVTTKYASGAVAWTTLTLAHTIPFAGVILDLLFSSF